MSIMRINKRETPFVQIDCSMLSDTRLSWKAKGVLAYLLSKPDQWKVYASEIEKRSTDGRSAVLSAIAELEESGYCTKSRVRGEDGKMNGWEYNIFERPQSTEVRKSDIGKTVIGKPATSNIDTSNKEESNKEKTSLVDLGQVAEEIYQAFPKKVQKQEALEVIQRKLKEFPPAELLGYATEYASYVQRWPKDKQCFAVNPATFFRRHRWEDDREEWARNIDPAADAPIREIVEIYNSFAGLDGVNWIPATQRDEGRARMLASVWRDQAKMDLDWFRRIWKRAADSPFLRARDKKAFMHLTWLFQGDNLTKLMEGNYDV